MVNYDNLTQICHGVGNVWECKWNTTTIMAALLNMMLSLFIFLLCDCLFVLTVVLNLIILIVIPLVFANIFLH